MRRRLLYHKLSKTEKELIWNTPVVNLSYSPSIAPSSGATMSPVVSWTQTAYYSDDPSTTAESLSGTSASEYEYTGSLNINTSTGVVTVDSTVIEAEQTLGTVTAKVTSNDKTGYSAPYTITQEAYVPDEPEPEPEPTGLPMDVVLWNKDDRQRYFVNKDDWSITKYPKDTYVPIGVVVIPLSHNRYNDNSKSIGVVSLMYASYERPASGLPDATQLYWGDYHDDGNYHGYRNAGNQCVIPYNVTGNTINSSYVGTREEETYNPTIVYAPSDDYSKLANSLDPGTYYKVDTMDSGCPSPYITDDMASSLYGTVSSEYGDMYAFGRFDGEDISIDYLNRLFETGEYIDWLHEGPVSLDYTSLALPAMEACWRYAPEGTHEGGWYLPSVGEYGYVMARKKLINETISQLDSAYRDENVNTSIYAQIVESGNTGTTAIPYTLTSSEYMDNSMMTRCVGYESNGGWIPVLNNVNGMARPFKRIRNVSGYGAVGAEPIPNNNTKYAGRYGVYREADTNGGSSGGWPDGILSGDVYAVRVADQYDYTVVQTDVKLFTINGLYSDDYVEATDDNLQFGYFDDTVEPGYYMIHYILRTNGEKVYNLNKDTYKVGDVISDGTDGNDTEWLAVVTVCSNYMNLDGLAQFASKGGNADYYGFNSCLYPIRVGYFNQDVAIWLTPHDYEPTSETVYIPRYGDTYSSMDPGALGAYTSGRFSTGTYIVSLNTQEQGLISSNEERTFYTSHLVNLTVGETLVIDADNVGMMGIQEPPEGEGKSEFNLELRFRSLDGTSHTLKSWSMTGTKASLSYKEIGSYTTTITSSDLGSNTQGYFELVSVKPKYYDGGRDRSWVGLCSPFVIEFKFD